LDAIPTGRWEGEGTYSSHLKNDAGEWEDKSGTYHTIVVVEAREVDNRKLRVLAVLADHSEDEVFDKESVHVVLTLGEPDGSAAGFNTHAKVVTKPETTLEIPGDAGVRAVMATDRLPATKHSQFCWLTSLDLRYETPDETGKSPFSERFTFNGNRLQKKGAYRMEDDGSYVRWTEKLRKVSSR
jgi:hypothetical protein